jgi:hypothetical protein
VNVSLIRRFLVFITLIILFFLSFLTINLIRFSPQDWFETHLEQSVLGDVQGEFSSNSLGTKLTWESLEMSYGDYVLFADNASVSFNLLSVAIGKPNIQQLTLDAPYLEIPEQDFSLQLLRTLISLGFQNLDLRNGALVSGQTEISDIELTLLKNGVFGEYAAQLSANVEKDDLNVLLNYSTLIGIDGEDKLVLGKNQFDANIVFLNWSGRIAGKIKSMFLTEENDAQFKFVNWSSSWKTNADVFPYTLDWAGGLTTGKLEADTWTFSTLDSALAYIDKKNNRHTFAIQSNETQLIGNDLVGQLGLSMLTEFPLNSEWQSYNLVMSGTMEQNRSILEWVDPDIRLSLIDDQNIQQTHFFKVKELLLDPSLSQWHLVDGEWNLVKDDLPAGDFGFGIISGDWPSMSITTAPSVADQIQPPLHLIATDIETLDALFNHLVP